MKFVYPWLIHFTGWVLRNPKLFILLPMLAIYILSYGVVHDLTVKPISMALSMGDHGPTLGFGDSAEIYKQAQSGNFLLSRISLQVPGNFVEFPILQQVHQLQESIETKNGARVLLPLSTWPQKLWLAQQFEASALRALNQLKPELASLFFDRLRKRNHLITAAGQISLYVVHLGELPLFEAQKPLVVLFCETSHAPNAATEFLKYFRYLREELLSLSIFNKVVAFTLLALCLAFVFRVYFSICNQHKIRSNFGFICGWVVEVGLASAASVRILAFYKNFQEWLAMFGPVSVYGIGTYVLAVMVFSSRTLFRTVNDLAGDNSMDGQETLHRRLIRFYLGINNSVRNSTDAIYKLLRLVRKLCLLDKFSLNILPIPNSFVVLCLNLTGLLTGFGCIFGLLHIFFLGLVWHLLVVKYMVVFEAIALALAIDHFLQQTFLVGIILIDLNRVELTDLLNKTPSLDDAESMGEIDPISSFLLGIRGPLSRPQVGSWRHILGTHILKLSPASSRRFWFGEVLSFFCWNFACQTFITRLVFPYHLLSDGAGVVVIGHQASELHSYNALFYLEVSVTILFIIAISELTFTLTYSQRQRKEVDPTATLVASSLLEYNELAQNEQTKYFESITLDTGHNIDVIKIATNSKSSFLVSTDLDRKVLVWSPLSIVEKKTPMSLSTTIDTIRGSVHPEFWPLSMIEISDEGNYIVLVNNRHSVIKCFERQSLSFIWEINLASELGMTPKELKPMLAFFRKKTIAGFLARKLLMKKRNGTDGRRSSVSSTASASTITGNFPPPPLRGDDAEDKMRDVEQSLNRDEFVMVFENGHMVTVGCTDRNVKHYYMFDDVYGKGLVSENLRITTAKQLTTSRVSDRIICDLVNGDIIIASAVSNVWKFSKLRISRPLVKNGANTLIKAPGVAMSRAPFSTDKEFLSMFKQNFTDSVNPYPTELPTPKRRFAAINHYTIFTIDFVGMVVRVRDLKAELLDIQTGIIIKDFFIGHFKPGLFRVIHSEPTHCKFCGCASVETMSFVYEDFYDPTLIVHTFSLESKKSRNNICLRVERDPREIRCLGFDAVVEKQYWYHGIEKWEATDMNVVMGIRKAGAKDTDEVESKAEEVGQNEEHSLLRRRKTRPLPTPEKPSINDVWQGFVVTVLNGQFLEYKIPFGDDENDSEFACIRPNVIAKYGYKAVALAFGRKIKILYLGGGKLIESDLYYKPPLSLVSPNLQAGLDGAVNRNDLLFINKRRRMLERRKNRD